VKRTILWTEGGMRWTGRDKGRGRQAGRGSKRRRNDTKTRHGVLLVGRQVIDPDCDGLNLTEPEKK
jgi:hypothetical protein